MFRSLLLTAASLLFAAAPAVSQEQVLAWKFKKGETFYMQEKMRQQQKVTTGGTTQEKDSTQTTITSFEVLSAPTSGGVTLKMTMLSVKEEGQGAGESQAILGPHEGLGIRSYSWL